MNENEQKQITELSGLFETICWDTPDEISEHCSISCSDCKAKYLYSKGYRKASEVAREIFEEIEKLIISRMIEDIPLIDDRLITDIAELKKKYGGTTNDGE